MKDNYVGDVGDYAKLTLLRYLARQSGLRLGIIWCKTSSSEANNDGKHRAFRDYSGVHSLNHCDEELFCGFSKFKDPDLRKIENLHEFLHGSEFFAEKVASPRSAWLATAESATSTSSVIFFDPDNGIDLGSSIRECSPKHVSIRELQQFWSRGKSLIVYHHLSRRRGGHMEEIGELTSCLQSNFPDAVSVEALHIRRGTARVFFLIVQDGHRQQLKLPQSDAPWAALTFSKTKWAEKQRLQFC